MTNPANKKPAPVDKHSTSGLVNIMHGAMIGLDESLADAQNFRRKVGQCIEELASRITHDGVGNADPEEVSRLRDELDAANDQLRRRDEAKLALVTPVGIPPVAPRTAPKPQPHRQTKRSAEDAARVMNIISAGLGDGNSINTITERLNAAGLTTVRGNRWTYQSVYQVARKHGGKREKPA